MNAVAMGADQSQRIGRKIKHRHMTWDLALAFPAATTTAMNEWGFYAVVLDRAPNGGSAAFGTMFDNSSGCPNGMAHKFTLDYPDRFVILKRVTWGFSPNSNEPLHDHMFIDFEKLRGNDQYAHYNAIGQVEQGQIIIVVANSNAATTSSGTTQGLNLFSATKYVFTDE
jgi:hypothetical protein